MQFNDEEFVEGVPKRDDWLYIHLIFIQLKMEGDRNVENFNNFVNKLHALEPLRYSTISAF